MLDLLYVPLNNGTLRKALTSPWFDCWNRNALDLLIESEQIPANYALVLLDVDKLKQANELYGKEGSSLRIRRSLAREKDKIYCVFSGDEMAAFVPYSDAVGFAQRLQSELHSNGLSATFVISDCEGNWSDTLDYVSNVNDCVKQMGLRDVIVDYRTMEKYFDTIPQ